MSIAFVRFGCTFLLVTASTIALLVCTGVGGCLCPISSRMIRMYIALQAIMYSALSSASVADVITCLIMCAMMSTALLLGGIVVLLD